MTRLKKEERREQIIRSATRIFAERGLAGTRTREIAEAAGINEALIYKHFHSKEELFAETMHHLHGELVAVWKGMADECPDARTALSVIFEHQIHTVFDNQLVCAGILQGFAASGGDEKVHARIREYFVGQHEFLRGLIRRGIGDGSLKPEIDPDRIAWWIRGISWSSILASWLGAQDSLDVEDSLLNLKEILDLITNPQYLEGNQSAENCG